MTVSSRDAASAKQTSGRRRPFPRSPTKSMQRPLFHSLRDEISAFLHLVVCSPWHDRYRGRRILGRAFDDAVGIDHINEHVAFHIAAARDLHLLEKQRAPLPEHVVTLLELGLEADRADLP